MNFDSQLLLLVRKLTQMDVVEGSTLMRARDKLVQDLSSSAESEEAMVVENKFVLKMVAPNDQNNSKRCRDCSHGLQA